MMVTDLCHYSDRFSNQVARMLGLEEEKQQRGLPLSRHFREESLTDILMGGLIPFEPHLIRRLDFARDEKRTGHDIEWEFVSFVRGKPRYLKLHIQAKRATATAVRRVWRYQHLDYDNGAQAAKLVATARAIGRHCVPLYLLYHPQQALSPASPRSPSSARRPAVEGANIMLANAVAKAVAPGRKASVRHVARWRPHFMPLSRILCWPQPASVRFDLAVSFLIGQPFAVTATISADGLAARLEQQRRDLGRSGDALASEVDDASIAASDDVPPATMRVIEGDGQVERVEGGPHRAIFVSHEDGLPREDGDR